MALTMEERSATKSDEIPEAKDDSCIVLDFWKDNVPGRYTVSKTTIVQMVGTLLFMGWYNDTGMKYLVPYDIGSGNRACVSLPEVVVETRPRPAPPCYWHWLINRPLGRVFELI
jgi:hypothetical protein